jgi:hypothetical protein
VSLQRDLSLIVGFASSLWLTGAASGAWAQAAAPAPATAAADKSDGDGVAPVQERVRRLPLWSEQARARGVVLPPTFGIGVVAVRDRQGVFGDSLLVSVAKGEPPPADVELVSVPSVSFDNVGSTDSVQVKGDLWLLPFLNLFVSLGKVEGDIAIDVVIDVDDLLGPPACRPAEPCGIKHLFFNSPLDNTIVTLGGTAAYGSERWFAAATLSRTVSIADKDRSDVSTSNFGVRVGPRLRVGNRFQVDPYVTVNWFKLDTRVQGTTGLPGAFPDGDDLSVRYDAHVENVDDYSLGVGVNAGLDSGLALQAEYGYAPHGERFLLTIVQRF